jgi:hypothetical protein
MLRKIHALFLPLLRRFSVAPVLNRFPFDKYLANRYNKTMEDLIMERKIVFVICLVFSSKIVTAQEQKLQYF